MNKTTAERLSEIVGECEGLSDMLRQTYDELIEKWDEEDLLARIPELLANVFLTVSDELMLNAMRQALDAETE